MNLARARDLYSQYREGTLESHAREALERAFQDSPQIGEDYHRFDEVLRAFEASKDEPVPEPYLLHERIVSRLDKALLDTKRNRAPLFSGWRMGLVGAVGAAAILAAVFSVNRGGGNATAEIIPTTPQSEMTWAAEGTGIRLFHSAGKGKVEVFAENTAEPEYEAPLGSARIEIPLVNRDSHAHVYRILAMGRSVFIALPGTNKETPDTGSGSVEQLAEAVATRFQTPVEIQYAELGEPAEWEFRGSSPVEVVVSGAPVSVQELVDGKLAIN